jgi:hypothetical protein
MDMARHDADMEVMMLLLGERARWDAFLAEAQARRKADNEGELTRRKRDRAEIMSMSRAEPRREEREHRHT